MMHGARRRRLYVHVGALQARHAHREQGLRLVEQRQRLLRRSLAGERRHPVHAVLGEQREPLGEAPLVEQPRLVQHEGLQLRLHRMCLSQASNWLRMASSLVPPPSVEPSAWRRSLSTPRRRSIQSEAAALKPRWQRSNSSRSSDATREAGEAARLMNCSVSSCISGAAPSSRKPSTSTWVRSAASACTTRIAAKREFTETFGHTRLLNRSTASTAAVFSSPWRSTSCLRYCANVGSSRCAPITPPL